MGKLEGITVSEFSEWYARKRAAESGAGAVVGAEGDVGLLAWAFSLIGWAPGGNGRAKRMRTD